MALKLTVSSGNFSIVIPMGQHNGPGARPGDMSLVGAACPLQIRFKSRWRCEEREWSEERPGDSSDSVL